MSSHGAEPDTPLRKPLVVSRRRNNPNTSDPANLEHHLALLARALAEPVRHDDGQYRETDRNSDRGWLRRLGGLVDLAAKLAELRFDVGARDRFGLVGRLRVGAHDTFLFFVATNHENPATAATMTTTIA